MDIKAIFETYTPGSQGFCIAVETHCGFEMSRAEIERVGVKAWECSDAVPGVGGYFGKDRHGYAAKKFDTIWQNERWWLDDEAVS